MNDTFEPETPIAMNIATISAGFEKGDFLVREEQGNRVYFDFFEEVGLLCVLPMIQFLLFPSLSCFLRPVTSNS